MKVLGIIPARGDSTGCPGKNLRTLGSKHVLQWTIDAWKAAGFSVRDLALSTEHGQLLLYGQMHGLRTIDQGPRTDNPIAIIDKVLSFWHPEIIVYLQPTTPFKRPEHIHRAVRMIDEGGCDSVVTMMPVPDRYHPMRAMEMRGGFISCPEEMPKRRQDFDERLVVDGCVYAVRTNAYLVYRSLFHRCKAIVTDTIDYCNIDTEEDWLEAEWRAAEIEHAREVDEDAVDRQAVASGAGSLALRGEGL